MSNIKNLITSIQAISKGNAPHTAAKVMHDLWEVIVSNDDTPLSDIHALSSEDIDYPAFLEQFFLTGDEKKEFYASETTADYIFGTLHDFGFAAEKSSISEEKKAIARRVVNASIKIANKLHAENKLDGEYGSFNHFIVRYALTPNTLKDALSLLDRSMKKSFGKRPMQMEEGQRYSLGFKYCQIVRGLHSYLGVIDINNHTAENAINKILLNAEQTFENIMFSLIENGEHSDAMLIATVFKDGTPATNPLHIKAIEFASHIAKTYAAELGDDDFSKLGEREQDHIGIFSETLRNSDSIQHINPEYRNI